MGWSNGWFKRQQLLQQKPHGTHLLLLLLHRILRSTTDLARDGVNLPAEDPGLPAIDVNIGLPQKRVQFHFECFVFRPKKKLPIWGMSKSPLFQPKKSASALMEACVSSTLLCRALAADCPARPNRDRTGFLGVYLGIC